MFWSEHVQPCKDDLVARMDRDKGALLDLAERLLLFSRQPLSVEARPRLHFSALGNTRGNTLGPIRLPDWTNKDETWTATVALKDKIFEGAKFGVGGICDQGPVDTPVVRQKADTEPVFWHARTPALHAEILHTLKVAGTVDCTPGDGLMAMAHIRARIPYVGVTLTATHKDEVYKRLQEMTFYSMANSDDKLAEPGLVALLRESGWQKNATDGGDDLNPAPTKKPRASTGKSEPVVVGDYITKIEAALAKSAAPKAKAGAATGNAAAVPKGKAKGKATGKAAAAERPPPPHLAEEEDDDGEEEDEDISDSWGTD